MLELNTTKVKPDGENTLTQTPQITMVRMLGGEQIIGEVWLTDEYEIKIKNPVRVVIGPSPSDPKASSVGLAPWFEFTINDTFDLNPGLIIASGTPHPDFVKQYKSIFSVVIQPESGIIVP
jgi:hypothetical protein